MLPARFESKIVKEPDDGCWAWTGQIMKTGYGRVRMKDSVNSCGLELAHRAVYELLKGPIPEGLQLDHLCRNRGCVNPNHLEPVDHRTNVLRGIGPTAINAAKIYCIHGHLLEQGRFQRFCRTCRTLKNKGGNIGRPITTYCPKGHLRSISSTGHRYCRTCGNESERKRRDKAKNG